MWRITQLLLFGIIGYCLIVAGMVVWQSQRDEAAPADAIVVLGTAQWRGRPSPVLRARLDHGVDLYHAGVAPYLITTGGHGRDPDYSEGGVGRSYAIQHGVPADAVLIEEVGRSTWESLQEVATLAQAQGIRRVVLVSDPFHMARAKLMARSLGLEPLTSPTRTSPISRRPGMEFAYVVREVVSLTHYGVQRVASTATLFAVAMLP